MDTILITAAVLFGVGLLCYFIFRKPAADVVLAGSTGAAQDLANARIQDRLKSIGRERGIRRHNGRYVYADDGSFIEDLILLDILMDGELDFNFVPDYDDAIDPAMYAVGGDFGAVNEALDAIPTPEQTWEKEGDLDVRDAPEVAVVESTRNYDSGYTPSDSGGGYSGGGLPGQHGSAERRPQD